MRTVDWRMLHEDCAEPGELRRVLTALAVSMGGDGGQSTHCSPSVARIGRRAGMRRDSASKWIRVAEQQGWINVGRITGLRNRYYATVPKELRPELEAREARAAEPKPKQVRKFRQAERVCPECGEPLVYAQVSYGPDSAHLAGTKAWMCFAHGEQPHG